MLNTEEKICYYEKIKDCKLISFYLNDIKLNFDLYDNCIEFSNYENSLKIHDGMFSTSFQNRNEKVCLEMSCQDPYCSYNGLVDLSWDKFRDTFKDMLKKENIKY